MSINQTNIVDAMGIDKFTKELVLTISDHMKWGNREHLLFLQEKLNTYLRSVESGELLNTYEDANERTVHINVILQYPPDKDGLYFLNQVMNVIENAGMKFSYSVL